jgi:hypothetical protein
LPGGTVYADVETRAIALEILLRRAIRVSRKYATISKEKPDGVTTSPTLAHIERHLVQGDPAIRQEDMEEPLKFAEPLVMTFEGFLDEVTALSQQEGKKQAAKSLLKQLYETDLSDADGAKEFDAAIKGARGPKPALRGLHATSGQAVTAEEATSEEELLPIQKKPKPRWHTFLTEGAVLALSLVAAFAVAWATLYANNPAWGSEGDWAAAVTWAFGVGGAIQVARHIHFAPTTNG